MTIEFTPNTIAGIAALLALSIIGILVFKDDKHLRMIAFGLGAVTAAVLAGLDLQELISKGYSSLDNADKIGIAASLGTMSVAALAPTAGLRRGTLSSGSMGLLSSLLGFPYWITVAIWAGVAVVLGFLAYKAIQKLASWWIETHEV